MINKVILEGNLTRDVETRTFQSGAKVARFGIAVNNSRKDKNTDQWINEPCFLDCAAWDAGEYRKLATYCDEKLAKGTRVLVEGKMTQENWKTNEGENRSKHVVVVDSIQPLPKPQKQGGEQPKQAYQGTQDSGPKDYQEPRDDHIPF